MRVLLRNLDSATLSLVFTGYDVDPLAVNILSGKSARVTTTLSVLDFRAIPDVAAALSAGELTISFSGDSQVLS